jgi:hypothetical protein
MRTKTFITNPRRILKIDKSMVDISIKRDPDDKSTKSFSFSRLDISSIHGSGSIKKDANIILEISSNIDTQRIDLGSYGSPKIIYDQLIELEGKKYNYTYHLFIVEGYEIRASNEQLRVTDPSKDNSDFRGFINVEPENLGEVAWRVFPVDGSSEPILQVNNDPEIDIFTRLHSMDSTFRSLIVINAIEQCLRALLINPGATGDEDAWQTNWKIFFSENNIDNIEDLDGDEDKQNWLQTTLDKISSKLLLFSKMKEAS